MKAINHYINKYFGFILFFAALLGLLMPELNLNTSLVIMVSLGTVIFASFFRITLNSELFKADWKFLPLYFLLRFLALPVIVYFLLLPFSSFYAVSLFILLLLPAAVSSPAFTAMFNGDVSLGLKILVFSSFLSILSIPGLMGLLLENDAQINAIQLLYIMLYTVALPFVIHLALRRSAAVSRILTQNLPLITAVGLIIIFTVSTSKNREVIFSDPGKVIYYALISAVIYILLYLIGFFLLPRCGKSKKIAYSVSSGANNIGIGVTLTMLFFPGEMNVFFIVSQLAWIFVLIPMRKIYGMLK